LLKREKKFKFFGKMLEKLKIVFFELGAVIISIRGLLHYFHII